MTLDQVSDIAQIVVGGASVIVAGLALRASREISTQQSRIAVNSSRAYLIPEHAQLSVFESGKPLEAQITIKNWGQTPALRSRATSRTYLANAKQNSYSGIPLLIDENKAELALPPQGGFVLGRLGKDETPITERQFQQLKTGELIFFCDLLTEYFDLAGEKHQTFVRYFLDKDKIIAGALPFLSLGKGGLSLS